MKIKFLVVCPQDALQSFDLIMRRAKTDGRLDIEWISESDPDVARTRLQEVDVVLVHTDGKTDSLVEEIQWLRMPHIVMRSVEVQPAKKEGVPTIYFMAKEDSEQFSRCVIALCENITHPPNEGSFKNAINNLLRVVAPQQMRLN